MSLIKWNSGAHPFPSASSWIEDFFQEKGFRPAVKGISIPAVNITENEEAIKLNVAAPGFKKEDFKLEIQYGCLTISGESKEEETDANETFTRREYAYNSFSRSFNLPENVSGEDITAQYADGVLKITLPKKKAEEKPLRQISVK